MLVSVVAEVSVASYCFFFVSLSVSLCCINTAPSAVDATPSQECQVTSSRRSITPRAVDAARFVEIEMEAAARLALPRREAENSDKEPRLNKTNGPKYHADDPSFKNSDDSDADNPARQARRLLFIPSELPSVETLHFPSEFTAFERILSRALMQATSANLICASFAVHVYRSRERHTPIGDSSQYNGTRSGSEHTDWTPTSPSTSVDTKGG